MSSSEHHHDHCGCGHDHEHHHHGDCGCGHDHEHHHHDGCGCGHDHEHHHHDNCGCGHDHEHHHHDSCGCGHDHEHHHPQAAPVHRPIHGGKTRIYILENLGCANCAAKMEDRIRQLDGVSDASITFATKQLRVTAADPDRLLPRMQAICSGIESQVLIRPREQAHDHDHAAGPRELAELLIGAGLFLLGLVLEGLGFGGWLSLGVFVAGYLVLGGRILLEAGRTILQGRIFDENFLMSLATLGAFAIREYPEAIGVMLFYRIGTWFEYKAVDRSRSQIMDALDLRPEVVHRIHGDRAETIPAEEARVGDVLLIRPGDRIPLDSTIIEGESRLDTAPLTGEPVPVSVKAGDSILSGCVNLSGQLKLQVDKPLADSMVSRILDSVEHAAASKPKIDRFISRFARIYTPVVVFAALATAVIPSLITGEWSYWIYTALSFLVMSCPCALVLSVPLAFFAGIGAGSKKGILFKGGVSMEALNGVRAVVMDKTGTLTRGDFRLQQVLPTGQRSQQELLRICAGVEQHSTHPIAHSITAAAREQGLTLTEPRSLTEEAGYGIAADTEDGVVLCGNRKLLARHGISVPALPDSGLGAEVYLAVNGQLEGRFRICDTVKDDAAAAVGRLHAMGLHTAMLTGDAAESADAVAAAVGIREVHARLLPQEKLEALAGIRSRSGAVLFVGDGINDAPVLAGADVGAAMGSGADAAIEAADAVFMTSAAEAIPDAVSIARRTCRIAMQNVVFALVIKLAVMVLGLCGHANMWMAVFADSGVAMLCVLNSIRSLYHKEAHHYV